MEIFSKSDSLFANVPNKVFWLRHYHYDVFEPFEKDPQEGIDTSDAGELKLQFNMDVSGNISFVSAGFEPTLKPIEFTRKEKEVAVSNEKLQKYTGEYEAGGMTAKVYLKNNTLYV